MWQDVWNSGYPAIPLYRHQFSHITSRLMELLSVTKMTNRIIKMYNLGDKADASWYTEAYKLSCELAQKYNTQTERVAGVIAALSPMKNWNMNIRLADDFFAGRKVGHTKAMVSKAEAIGTADIKDIPAILNGNKITNFYSNIINPSCNTRVTIDRHAIMIAMGGVNLSQQELSLLANTDKKYKAIADAYRRAAKKLGVRPLEVQAVTWVVWRKIKSYR